MSPPSEIYFQAFLPPHTKVTGQIFGFLDSLGKNLRKEVVSDLAILAWKWSKIVARFFF